MEHHGRIDSIISLKQVPKTSESAGREKEVVRDVSLEIREDEFVALFDPGRCGKTTLLNMIAGLGLPTGDEAYVDEKLVAGLNTDWGVIYRITALFPFYAVMGNVEFGPKSRGTDKKTRQERAQYFTDLMGLQGSEKSYPDQLSGDIRQRMGIARAYCNDPKVILFDGPFSHLDAQTRYMMEEELEKIQQREKRTVVFVTNNVEEAVYLADRIILLTNCPSTIKGEYLVDLPRPRSYVDPAFLKLHQEITDSTDDTLQEGNCHEQGQYKGKGDKLNQKVWRSTGAG